jgi:type IV pilus assembly protein PilA
MKCAKSTGLKAERRSRAGFTLVELSVVIVIIGVLAAFAVPRFAASVERAKAGEAFNYLNAIRSSQENYNNREGTYATNYSDLDVNLATPKYFSLPENMNVPAEDQWSLTLTRLAGASGYGAYTVTYNQGGFDNTSNSNIPMAVNPMGT